MSARERIHYSYGTWRQGDSFDVSKQQEGTINILPTKKSANKSNYNNWCFQLKRKSFPRKAYESCNRRAPLVAINIIAYDFRLICSYATISTLPALWDVGRLVDGSEWYWMESFLSTHVLWYHLKRFQKSMCETLHSVNWWCVSVKLCTSHKICIGFWDSVLLNSCEWFTDILQGRFTRVKSIRLGSYIEGSV